MYFEQALCSRYVRKLAVSVNIRRNLLLWIIKMFLFGNIIVLHNQTLLQVQTWYAIIHGYGGSTYLVLDLMEKVGLTIVGEPFFIFPW